MALAATTKEKKLREMRSTDYGVEGLTFTTREWTRVMRGRGGSAEWGLPTNGGDVR